MKTLILIFLLIIPVFAQATKTDTTSSSDDELYLAEYNPLFPDQTVLKVPSLRINSKYLDFQNDPTDFFVTSYLASEKAALDSSEMKKIEFKQIGKTLNSSMFMMYNIKAEKDPTLLRQILGTVGTAAAFGLAGYHIYKYHIKKER